MKNLHYLFLAVLMAFSGCSGGDDDPEGPEVKPVKLELSSTSPYVTVNGTSCTVNFRPYVCEAAISVKLEGTTEWDVAATTGGDLFTVDKSTDSFTIACVGENESGAPKTGTFTVTAGTDSNKVTATVSVTQEAYGAVRLSISPTSITIPETGGDSEPVTIDTDAGEWDFETGVAWLDGRKEGNTLILTAQANDTEAPKTAEVEITATEGSESATEILYVTLLKEVDVTVTLTLTPDEVSFDTSSGGTESVTVTTNQDDWTVGTPSESWVEATKSETGVTIEAAANEDSNEKTATVSVTVGPEGNTVTKDITVKIPGKVEIEDDPSLLVLEVNIESLSPAFRVPLVGTLQNCSINWGDGTITNHSGTFTTSNYPEHVYTKTGTYRIKISGKATGINSASLPTNSKRSIVKVVQWGKTGLTSMYRAFDGCSKLASIAGDTQQSFLNVVDFTGAFADCAALESIPADLFKYAEAAKSFLSTFSCGVSNDQLTSVPEGLFDNCSNATTFEEIFYRRGNLETIPAKLFAKCPKVTTFKFAFRNNTSLKSVSADIFEGLQLAADFQGTFAFSGLTSIPEDLFKSQINATNFQSTFDNCPITSIPAGLFANNAAATTFQSCFSGTAITAIPGELFANNTKVTTFNSVFSNCKNLLAVPENLLANSAEVTEYASAFLQCTALKTLPATLFNGTKANGYNSTTAIFMGCSSLETVPETIFDTFTGTRYMASIFKDCSKLNNIPEGIFSECILVISFESAFQSCSSLTSVPKGIFANNTEVTSFQAAFRDCANLKTVDISLLDNNLRVSNVQHMFYNCSSYEGTSINTKVGDDYFKLWQRTAGWAEDATALFATSGCYYGCTKLADYDDIPSSGWK